MLKFILTLYCIVLSVSVAAETVYKKTNPDGSVEFTDQASQDSEEVKVREPTTYTAPRLPRLNLPSKKLSPGLNYSLVITKPVNNTIIHNKIDIVVSVTLQPALNRRYNHKIRYQLAGQSIVSENDSVTFKNVNRGTHRIEASIINAEGEVVSPVASTVFHLKRFFKKPPPPKVKPKVPSPKVKPKAP